MRRSQTTICLAALLLASALLLCCCPPSALAARVIKQHHTTVQHSAPLNTTSHVLAAAHGRVMTEDTDCSAALQPGGPKSTMSQALELGLGAASSIPGTLGTVASALGGILSFVGGLVDEDAGKVSGQSIYNCISGFVEAAIDNKLNEQERNGISTSMKMIKVDMVQFRSWVKNAPRAMTPDYQAVIQEHFTKVVQDTGDLFNWFTVGGARNPTGLLSDFTTFTTTQHLPILKMRYDNANAISGFNTSADTLSGYIRESREAIDTAIAAYDLVSKNFVDYRMGNITDVETDDKLFHSVYSFKDHVSGQVFTTTVYDTRDEDSRWRSIQDQRRFVVNRVGYSTKINLYQGTSSRPTWPLIQAGGSGLILKQRLVVEKGMCWSNSVDCTGGRQEPMPAGHNYEDFNISKIEFHSGSFVDAIKVHYTHRITGQVLTQSLGNPNGGGYRELSGLLSNPVVKAKWNSEPADNGAGISFLSSVEFFQADGKGTLKAGTDAADSSDDFSFWSGNVWLCGLVMHGDDNNRVHGIAPHWCYHEFYTEPAPPPPSPPSPPPPMACTSDADCGVGHCCSPSQRVCTDWIYMKGKACF